MKADEAIEILKTWRITGDKAHEALDMAIDALKTQQLKHDQNSTSKQPDLETLGAKTGETCADAISRQDAIRIVDGIDTWQAGWRGNAIESMKALPSAQPEIVRCKECKHRHIENKVWHCPFGLPGGELFYCAYGAERRTDG